MCNFLKCVIGIVLATMLAGMIFNSSMIAFIMFLFATAICVIYAVLTFIFKRI
jgi:hypothetical protein